MRTPGRISAKFNAIYGGGKKDEKKDEIVKALRPPLVLSDNEDDEAKGGHSPKPLVSESDGAEETSAKVPAKPRIKITQRDTVRSRRSSSPSSSDDSTSSSSSSDDDVPRKTSIVTKREEKSNLSSKPLTSVSDGATNTSKVKVSAKPRIKITQRDTTRSSRSSSSSSSSPSSSSSDDSEPSKTVKETTRRHKSVDAEEDYLRASVLALGDGSRNSPVAKAKHQRHLSLSAIGKDQQLYSPRKSTDDSERMEKIRNLSVSEQEKVKTKTFSKEAPKVQKVSSARRTRSVPIVKKSTDDFLAERQAERAARMEKVRARLAAKENGENDEDKDPLAVRRNRIFSYYNMSGQGSRENLMSRISNESPTSSILMGARIEDIDLLPWNETGTALHPSDMMKLILSQK